MVYQSGHQKALESLGLENQAGSGLYLRPLRDPFAEIAKKLQRAFRIKTPKFDVSAMLKRLLNNPLKQPRTQLSGKWKGLRL